MAFVKLENGIVVQKQPYPEEGFVKASDRVVCGMKLSGRKYCTPDQPADFLWSELRNERNRLLSASDWTQVFDAPVDRAAWALYRQALRNLPATATDPSDAVWPIEPVS